MCTGQRRNKNGERSSAVWIIRTPKERRFLEKMELFYEAYTGFEWLCLESEEEEEEDDEEREETIYPTRVMGTCARTRASQ
jgi:hypothetical protein